MRTRLLVLLTSLSLPTLAVAGSPAPPQHGQKAKTPSPAQVAPRPIFPFPMEVRTLPSGLTVIFVPFDSPGLAAYYSLVRTGSRNEVEPGRSGFAHFFEHMMFRGTEKHPKEQYDALLSRAGVSNNAFTTDDFTAYHCYGPSSQLPLIIELESDRFRNLKYSEDDFRTEAKAVLGEYNKNFSNPSQKLEEALVDTAFAVHPYKHTTMGFKEDIEAMPSMYAYSLEFFRRWYTPDNTTLVIVGDFDRPRTMELIEKAYGPWHGRAASIPIPSEPPQTALKTIGVPWNNPTQPRYAVVFHTPAARSSTLDSALQNVLGPYLFGPTSPTFRELVLERQLVTTLAPLYFDHRDPNLFGAYASLKGGEDFPAVAQSIDKAFADLRAGKVDLTRFEAVKSNQKYGLLQSFDNPDAVALQLVLAIGPTGDPQALNALFNNMEKLTSRDLVAFAKAHFVPSNETRAALTGPGDKPPAGFPEYRPSPSAQAHRSKQGGAP